MKADRIKEIQIKAFKALPWLVPVLTVIAFWVPFKGLFAAVVLFLNLIVAAGLVKLFFPQLFDDVFTNQKAIKNLSTPDYNLFQIRRYSLGWWMFFSVWAMLNVLKVLI